MTEIVGTTTTLAANYVKYVQPPVQWAAVGWSGQNLTEVQDMLAAHAIEASAMLAGTDTLLLLPVNGTSLTYSVGTQVVICNDGGAAWRLEPERQNLDGLAPLSDYYVLPTT